MNAKDLIAFLEGHKGGRDLQVSIDSEVHAWTSKLRERGRSAPITLHGMHETFDITPARATRLLDAFLTGELTQESFAYVLDALLLEDKFRWTSHAARESLESILAPESRRELDKRRAWKAREELLAMSRT